LTYNVRFSTVIVMKSATATAYPALVERVRAAQLPPPVERQRIRRAARASLSAVAAELGVSPMTVLRWERGESDPRLDHAAAYGALLASLRDALAS
jgi:DNA-binding XRE family transcriptional regulator